MNDRELRDSEKLKTKEDYKEEIRSVSQLFCESKKADAKIAEILDMLADALKEKYDCIIEDSGVYRKKRGFFGRIFDWFSVRRDRKRAIKPQINELEQSEEQYKAKVQDETARVSSLIASTSQEVEVIEDNSKNVMLLENREENPENTNASGGSEAPAA